MTSFHLGSTDGRLAIVVQQWCQGRVGLQERTSEIKRLQAPADATESCAKLLTS